MFLLLIGFRLISRLFKGSYPLSLCLFDVFRVIRPKLFQIAYPVIRLSPMVD